MSIGEKYQCVIIGGGISGLSTALTLATEFPSISWVVLEASDKMGGRIQHKKINKTYIDTGAYEFPGYLALKKDENNSKNLALFTKIQNGFASLDYRTHLTGVQYYEETQNSYKKYTEQEIKKAEQIMQEFRIFCNKMSQNSSLKNESVEQAYIDFKKNHLISHSSSLQNLFNLMLEMQQQQHSGPQNNIALDSFFASGEIQDDVLDSHPQIVQNYGGIVSKLVQELQQINSKNQKGDIVLNAKVTKITRLGKQTVVEYQNLQKQTKSIICDTVVCSVPLPLLKNGSIKIQPQLPKEHKEVIDGLGVGQMQKIIISFEQRFWDQQMHRIKIASKDKGKFMHFVNMSPHAQNTEDEDHILCCFITSDFALNLNKKYSDSEIIEQVLEILGKIYPNKNIKVKDYHLTKWHKEPFIQCAFSYIGKNLRFEKAKTIRKSVGNWLWFVGEHCYPQNIGCAHGAYETGVLAAKEIGIIIGQQSPVEKTDEKKQSIHK